MSNQQRIQVTGEGSSFTFGGSEDVPIPRDVTWTSMRSSNINLGLGTIGQQASFYMGSTFDYNTVQQSLKLAGEIR